MAKRGEHLVVLNWYMQICMVRWTQHLLVAANIFYFFIDECSWMKWVYFLQFKSETFTNFKKFKAFVGKRSDLFIKTLWTDRGGDFLSYKFKYFVMSLVFTESWWHHTPQSKMESLRGRTEQLSKWRKVYCKGKNLANSFWAKAVVTSVYLLNISPTKVVLNYTLYEAWKGRKP